MHTWTHILYILTCMHIHAYYKKNVINHRTEKKYFIDPHLVRKKSAISPSRKLKSDMQYTSEQRRRRKKHSHGLNPFLSIRTLYKYWKLHILCYDDIKPAGTVFSISYSRMLCTLKVTLNHLFTYQTQGIHPTASIIPNAFSLFSPGS